MREKIADGGYIRPQFNPLPPEQPASIKPGHDEISSLPDLIRFNAVHNKDRVFCKQAVLSQNQDAEASRDTGRFQVKTITFEELQTAVQACKTWATRLLHLTENRSATSSQKPVALFMESDMGLFIHLAALLDLQVPVSIQDV